MNWMGGARNRLRFNGDRNIQKEFFDRKRLGPKLSLDKSWLKKKRQVSQDILALQTVSRAHSDSKNGPTSSRAFKSVDLDKFQSCTRQINEIDMGPCSPVKTPSSLLLADGKSENRLNNPSAVKFHESQSFNHSNMSKDLTEDKPKMAMDRDSGYSFTERSLHKEEAPQQKDLKRLCQKNFSAENHQDKLNMDPSYLGQSKTVGTKSSRTDQRFDSPFSMVHNPFISEDFQVTPVTKYDLHKMEHKPHHKHMEHKPHHKHMEHKPHHKHHHKSKVKEYRYCKNEPQCLNETNKYSKYVPFQFSSTPLKRNVDQTVTSNFMQQNSNIQLSPIKNLSSQYKDDFQYKPRPMTNTKQNKVQTDNKSHTGTMDISRSASVMDLYAHNNDQSDIVYHSDTESMSKDTITPLKKLKYLKMETPVMQQRPSDLYKKIYTSGNKEKLSDSYCDKDSAKWFKSYKTPCSALSIYKSSLSENDDISPQELQKERKSKFVDIEDNFVYKPNLSFRRIRATDNTHCSPGSKIDMQASSDGSDILNRLPNTTDSSPLLYVPIKNEMDDVLKEMIDLEKQDKQAQESQTSLDLAIKSIESHNDIPNTEEDEADKFLESEIEDLEMLAHTSETSKTKLGQLSIMSTTKIDSAMNSFQAFSQENMLTKEADSQTKNDCEYKKQFVNLPIENENFETTREIEYNGRKNCQADCGEEMLNLSCNTLNETQCSIVVQVADVSSGKNQTTQTDVQTHTAEIDVQTVETQTAQYTLTLTVETQTTTSYNAQRDTEIQTEKCNSCQERDTLEVETQTDRVMPLESLAVEMQTDIRMPSESLAEETQTDKKMPIETLVVSEVQTDMAGVNAQIEITSEIQTKEIMVKDLNTQSVSIGVQCDGISPCNNVPNLLQLTCGTITKLTKKSFFSQYNK